jgi:hypothetical protein
MGEKNMAPIINGRPKPAVLTGASAKR